MKKKVNARKKYCSHDRSSRNSQRPLLPAPVGHPFPHPGGETARPARRVGAIPTVPGESAQAGPWSIRTVDAPNIASKPNTNHANLQGFPCSPLAILRASTVATPHLGVLTLADLTCESKCQRWCGESMQFHGIGQGINTSLFGCFLIAEVGNEGEGKNTGMVIFCKSCVFLGLQGARQCFLASYDASFDQKSSPPMQDLSPLSNADPTAAQTPI